MTEEELLDLTRKARELAATADDIIQNNRLVRAIVRLAIDYRSQGREFGPGDLFRFAQVEMGIRTDAGPDTHDPMP